MKSGWTGAVVGLMAAGIAANAWAAKVTYVKGEVTIGSAEAKAGSTLAAGDKISTSKDGAGIIELDDGSVAKLGPSTSLSYTKVNGVELLLDRGTVFSKVAKQAQGRTFRIKSKSATMGVRGTQFFTSYGSTAKSQDDLWMCVKEGSVEVESSKDGKKVLVKEGEGILVPKSGEITPPKPYEWTKSLNWNMDPAKGDVEDHSSVDSGYDLLKQNYD